MNVADYIFNYLKFNNIGCVFTVVGGSSMFLNNALKNSGIKYICCHHEQACSFAAEGYSRTKNALGVALVTGGPGGLNCLSGVMGQWTDSIPVLYISGQVKTSMMSHGDVRQLGDQEVDIVSIVRHITKYSCVLDDAASTKFCLEHALRTAMCGRKGPVWLDIPLDVQKTEFNETIGTITKYKTTVASDKTIDAAYVMLKNAKNPLIVAGHGIRLSNAKNILHYFLDLTGYNVVTTFNGCDLIPSTHRLFRGRIGTIGNNGNDALQSADVVMFIGTRNNVRQTGFDVKNFAKNAVKIVVDIDIRELDKETIKPDLDIHGDANDFLFRLTNRYEGA